MDPKVQEIINAVSDSRPKLLMKMIWEWDPNTMSILSSYIYAAAGVKPDVDSYAACKKLLKSKVGPFNEMRGLIRAVVITKMALSSDPEAFVDGTLAIYKMLRERHFFTASPYMVMAAMTLYEAGGLEKADENIEKMESLYRDMRAEHPLMTTDEDRPLVAMLAAGRFDKDRVMTEIERCYAAMKTTEGLKSTFNERKHAASQILSLVDRPAEEKAEELSKTLKAMKAAGAKFWRSDVMSVAAALQLVDKPMEEKAQAVGEIYKVLRHTKGFGFWRMGWAERTMYSVLTYVIATCGDATTALNAATSATMDMIIEEIIDLVIMMMIINTSSHMSSSSSGSGSAA